jgi:hypothetical protein
VTREVGYDEPHSWRLRISLACCGSGTVGTRPGGFRDQLGGSGRRFGNNGEGQGAAPDGLHFDHGHGTREPMTMSLHHLRDPACLLPRSGSRHPDQDDADGRQALEEGELGEVLLVSKMRTPATDRANTSRSQKPAAAAESVATSCPAARKASITRHSRFSSARNFGAGRVPASIASPNTARQSGRPEPLPAAIPAAARPGWTASEAGRPRVSLLARTLKHFHPGRDARAAYRRRP